MHQRINKRNSEVFFIGKHIDDNDKQEWIRKITKQTTTRLQKHNENQQEINTWMTTGSATSV
jgi:gluconate kinase